jgi:threonine aldolase
VIDLRSDTVTLPTPAMREAMARADVGDDQYGEDPTVQRLEALAAAMLGKAAALLVVSGTMGNLVALLTHCARGDAVLVGDQQHIVTSERGGAAALGGVVFHTLPNQRDGTLALDHLTQAMRPGGHLAPRPRVVALENTHLRAGGAPLHPAYLQQVRSIADAHGVAIHVDGARIFNAAVALGVDVRDLTREADSVQCCLSKGLAAPVGAILAGDHQFIAQARLVRQQLGGAMRQAGVIAAAGIVALETMVDRLAEDHANARYLAERLAELPGLKLDPATVRTNIVLFAVAPGVMTAAELAAQAARAGVRLQVRDRYLLRATTHYGISRADVEQAVAVIRHVLSASEPSRAARDLDRA